MTREEVADHLKAAIEKHFNSDGREWGFSVGAPPDAFGLSDHPSIHNFMVTVQAPLNE